MTMQERLKRAGFESVTRNGKIYALDPVWTYPAGGGASFLGHYKEVMINSIKEAIRFIHERQ